MIISRGRRPDSLNVEGDPFDITFDINDLHILFGKPHVHLSLKDVQSQGQLFYQKLTSFGLTENTKVTVVWDSVTCKFPWYSLLTVDPAIQISIVSKATPNPVIMKPQTLSMLVIVNSS